MKKQLAWIFGSGTILGLGCVLSLGACSGDDNKGTDAGKDVTQGQDTGKPDVAPQQDSGTQDTGTDSTTADCGSIPSLHVSEAGSIFCGFPADGGPSFSCPTGQECCLGGKQGTSFDPEECLTFGATCDNPSPDASTSPGLAIECNQNADCTANGKTNNVCCLQGATAPALVAGCGYYKSSPGGTAVTCEPANNGACTGTGDIQICSATSDCPSGKTCTPMKWKLYQLGFCL